MGLRCVVMPENYIAMFDAPEAQQAKAIVKKVTSSHKTGKTEILAESAPDTEKLRAVIEATGYRVTHIQSEPYEKKGFSLFHK